MNQLNNTYGSHICCHLCFFMMLWYLSSSLTLFLSVCLLLSDKLIVEIVAIADSRESLVPWFILSIFGGCFGCGLFSPAARFIIQFRRLF